MSNKGAAILDKIRNKYQKAFSIPKQFLPLCAVKNVYCLLILTGVLFIFSFSRILSFFLSAGFNFSDKFFRFYVFYYCFDFVFLIISLFFVLLKVKSRFLLQSLCYIANIFFLSILIYVLCDIKINFVYGMIYYLFCVLISIVVFDFSLVYYFGELIYGAFCFRKAYLFQFLEFDYKYFTFFFLVLFIVVLFKQRRIVFNLSNKMKVEEAQKKILALENENEVLNQKLNFEKRTGNSKFQEQTQKLIRTQYNTIVAILSVVENRNGISKNHINRVTRYVELLAKRTRKAGFYTDILTDDFIICLIKATPLHDIGKLVIPDEILSSPDKLSEKQFEIVKSHTVEGAKIVQSMFCETKNESFLKVLNNVTLYHHEKIDGSGYPMGLYGDKIPLESRIVAIADVFDTLHSVRSYKPAFSIEKAFSIIDSESSLYFDPILVKQFLSLKDEIIRVNNDFKD